MSHHDEEVPLIFGSGSGLGLGTTGINLFKSQEKEAVNHPIHYGGDTVYEHHKVVRAWGLGYALGNATKYICRGGKKTPDAVEDLKKAIWYIQSEIDFLESKK